MTPRSSVTRFGNFPSSGYWELTERQKDCQTKVSLVLACNARLTSICDTSVDEESTIGVDFDDDLEIIHRVHQLVRPGSGFVGGSGVDSSGQRPFGEISKDLLRSRHDLWFLGNVDSVVLDLTLMFWPLGNDVVSRFLRDDVPDLVCNVTFVVLAG